jgi:acyl carrier protein
MSTEVKAAIVKVINEHFIRDRDIDSSFHFEEDLGMDSTDVLELVIHIEEELGIEIPDEDLVQVRTVGDMVRAVKKRSK